MEGYQNVLIAAKSHQKALIDPGVIALVRQQTLIRWIDSEAGHARQGYPRHAYQENDHYPLPADQIPSKQFHGVLRGFAARARTYWMCQPTSPKSRAWPLSHSRPSVFPGIQRTSP